MPFSLRQQESIRCSCGGSICSNPCTPVVARRCLRPKQGHELVAARPSVAIRVAEVPLQSHTERDRSTTFVPLVSSGPADITGRRTDQRLSLQSVGFKAALCNVGELFGEAVGISTQGSTDWHQAADPPVHYGLVHTDVHLQGSTVGLRCSEHSLATGQREVNNIVGIKTLEATDVIELEKQIGVLKQKVCNTRNLEQLRIARIETLKAAIISHGLNLPATVEADSRNAASLQQPQQHSEQAWLTGGPLVRHQAVTQEQDLLMQRCRSLNQQIQTLEAVLKKAGALLPRHTLASVSLSSYSPSNSVSSTGTLGEDDLVLSTITFPAATQPEKPPRRHTVKCQFEVKCCAAPGEKVWILGDHPSLGSWDFDNGHPLELQNSGGNIWKGDLDIEWEEWAYYNPKVMAFKAVKQRIDGRMEWQQGDNLEVLLGPSLGHHVHPCVASFEFDCYCTNSKPLNFDEACLATYYLNYDNDVPEAFAKRKAKEDVEKCLQQLRHSVAAVV